MADQPEMGFVERHASDEFSVVEHSMAPGIIGAPLHTHSREDEFSYIVSGNIHVQLGDRLLELGPRDVIWKPRGVPHAFWNASSEPALVLELIIPGGFECYFRELVELAHASGGGPPDRERMVEVQRRYGLEMDLASIPMLMEKYGVRPPRM